MFPKMLTLGLVLTLCCAVELPAQVANEPVQNAPAQDAGAMPLKPREAKNPGETKRIDGMTSLPMVAGSLAIVLGIFFLLVWVLRRTSTATTRFLPKEAFEVVGRAALANRHQVQLLRCGERLLLVSLTAASVETLTEITDPEEVGRLIEACRAYRRAAGSHA